MSNTNSFGINYTTILNPDTIQSLLESRLADNHAWQLEIDRALSLDKEYELYTNFVNKLPNDKYGRFIRAYISFKRYVNYDELKQIAQNAGLVHQMDSIGNPNVHDLNSILSDDNIKKDVRTLVDRVLSVSRKNEQKMRDPR